MKPDVLRGQVEPDVLRPCRRRDSGLVTIPKGATLEFIKANAGHMMFAAAAAAIAEAERRRTIRPIGTFTKAEPEGDGFRVTARLTEEGWRVLGLKP